MSIINKVKLALVSLLSNPLNKVILPVLKIAVPILTVLAVVYAPIRLAALILNAVKSGCEALSSVLKSWDEVLRPKEPNVIPKTKSEEELVNEYCKKLVILKKSFTNMTPDRRSDYESKNSRYVMRRVILSQGPKEHVKDKSTPRKKVGT